MLKVLNNINKRICIKCLRWPHHQMNQLNKSIFKKLGWSLRRHPRKQEDWSSIICIKVLLHACRVALALLHHKDLLFPSRGKLQRELDGIQVLQFWGPEMHNNYGRGICSIIFEARAITTPSRFCNFLDSWHPSILKSGTAGWRWLNLSPWVPRLRITFRSRQRWKCSLCCLLTPGKCCFVIAQ